VAEAPAPRTREILYSAEPDLHRPIAFLRTAAGDLAGSLGAARRLFAAGLRARHRRSWLGYLWLVLPALAAAGIWTFLHGRNVVAVRPTALPYPLFVLSGMLLWQTFLDGLMMPQQQLLAHRQLLSRMPVPHETVLLAGMADLALTAAVRLALLAAALLLAGTPMLPSWGLVPLGVALLGTLGVAFGLLLAPVGMLYDDVGRIVGVGATFLLLLTPVLYPLPARGLFRLNLVTPLLETTRGWITGPRTTPDFLAVAAAALVGLLLSWLLYRLARPHVAARLG
jgi:lipopolysaccharide transport system permease protein